MPVSATLWEVLPSFEVLPPSSTCCVAILLHRHQLVTIVLLFSCITCDLLHCCCLPVLALVMPPCVGPGSTYLHRRCLPVLHLHNYPRSPPPYVGPGATSDPTHLPEQPSSHLASSDVALHLASMQGSTESTCSAFHLLCVCLGHPLTTCVSAGTCWSYSVYLCWLFFHFFLWLASAVFSCVLLCISNFQKFSW